MTAAEEKTLTQLWNDFQLTRLHAAANSVYSWSDDCAAYNAYVAGDRDTLCKLTESTLAAAELSVPLPRKQTRAQAQKASQVIADGMASARADKVASDYYSGT